ncbi:MAG: hypothetical protein R3F39_25360 [Myxococcota bacterium]
MTWEDPIVAEIRAVRDAHAKEYDYDLDRIVAALIAEQEDSGRELYQGTPQPLRPRPMDAWWRKAQ